MAPLLRREIERVLDLVEKLAAPAAGRAAGEGPPPLTGAVAGPMGSAELRTLVGDTLTLLDWFPALDDQGSQFRRRLERWLR
jgi:hypothetical protein